MGAAVRRSDVDWLRVLATYLLFAFHTSMVFNPTPFFHIRNDEQHVVFLVFAGFVSLWHMPLFFFLAGWSMASSLAERGPRGYLRERMQRLAVPLLFGVALWGPVMKFFELRSGLDLNFYGLRVDPALQDFNAVIPKGLPAAAPFHESFLEFWPTFFTQFERVTWGHLWFVAYLLTLSVLYLPLLTWIRPHLTRVRMPRIALHAPLVALVLIQLLVTPHFEGVYNLVNDWGHVLYYSVFLISGFALASAPKLEQALAGEWRPALGIALAASLALLGRVLEWWSSEAWTLGLVGVAGWYYVIGFVGMAQRHLRRDGRVLRYLSESAFPVYILHQPAIIVVGFVWIALPLGVFVKFGLVLVSSIAVTLLIYELFVRRFAVLRTLHGMRPSGVTAQRRALVPAAAQLLAVVVVVTPSSSRASEASIEGRWWADGGSAQVEILERQGELVGRVVWLRSPFDENGCPLVDAQNPDVSLRARRVEGLELLSGLRRDPEEAGAWNGGRIYDPGSGRSYRLAIRMEGPDRLLLRGFVGFELIGQTRTWIRVRAVDEDAPMCTAPRS